MLKLVRLEWKKNNIGKYIKGVIIMAALLGLFVFALAFLGIANDPEGSVTLVQHYPKEMPVMLLSVSMRISDITDRHSARFSSRDKES